MRSVSLPRLALALVAGGLLTAPALAGDNTPGVFPPNARPGGLTYGEWSARHWQWVYSLPADAHPLLDTAGVGAGQSGDVWFLGGTYASTELEPGVFVGRVTRDVVIPPGTKLFFPLVNAEASTVEGNGTTEDELRAAATFFADFIDPDSLFCEVDGRPVRDLPGYRVQSPLFTFGPLPAGNLLELFGYDAPAGTTSPSVSDGVFVMLAPLAAGRHTVRFGGVVDLTPAGGPLFVQDITYHISVRRN